VNGVWAGSLTVSQAETNLLLKADDGAGHTGQSNPFQVLSGGPAPSITSPRQLSNGQFQFTLLGTPGCNYEIEVSTNLQSWDGLRVLSMTNSTCDFLDASGGMVRRFYRARLAQ
jgi:hypothetical protein